LPKTNSKIDNIHFERVIDSSFKKMAAVGECITGEED